MWSCQVRFSSSTKRPYQPKAGGQQAQQPCHLAHPALLAIRTAAVEIHQPQSREAHPRRIAVAEIPQGAVEQRDHGAHGDQERSGLAADHQIAAQQKINST